MIPVLYGHFFQIDFPPWLHLSFCRGVLRWACTLEFSSYGIVVVISFGRLAWGARIRCWVTIPYYTDNWIVKSFFSAFFFRSLINVVQIFRVVTGDEVRNIGITSFFSFRGTGQWLLCIAVLSCIEIRQVFSFFYTRVLLGCGAIIVWLEYCFWIWEIIFAVRNGAKVQTGKKAGMPWYGACTSRCRGVLLKHQ